MQNASSPFAIIMERLSRVVTEITELSLSEQLSPADKARLEPVLREIKRLQSSPSVTISESQPVLQIPVFDSTDLVSRIKLATSNENALRTVMLATDIPIHWSTIYQRIYPLIRELLRPQDELPQHGHPGLLRWQYRLSWQMQLLRAQGVVRSTGDGYWMRIDPDAPQHQPALFDSF